MKKVSPKKSVSTGTVLALSASALALAAGAYYFFGPEGKKNRGAFKGWMIKMKGEIIEKMEQAKDVSEESYYKIVDTIAAKYGKNAKVVPAELKAFVTSLKSQWGGVHKTAKKAATVKK